MQVRKLIETDTTITLGWDPVPGQVGYIPSIDGNEKLTDGKRHIGYPSSATQVRIGKPADDQQHVYGVKLLGIQDQGVYNPSGTVIQGPQGSLRQQTGAYWVRTPSAGTSPGVIEKIHVTSSPDFGPSVMQWPAAEWPTPYVVRDCIADNVVLPPFDWEGFNESGFWFGQKVHAYRLIARNAEWMAAFTGSRFHQSIVEHFQFLAMPWIGLYPEHVSADSIFRFFNIESRKNGINVEWSYPSEWHADFYNKVSGINGGGRAGSFGLKWHSGRVRSLEGYCMYLDAGTFGCEIAKDGYLDLDGPWGIRLPKRLMDPSRPNIVHMENINWNSIPPERRVTYHDDPIGVYRVNRFAFGLKRGRIEGKRPHQRIRDWVQLSQKIDLRNSA